MPQSPHIAVLSEQVKALLSPSPGESYLDLTAGYGGHARLICDITKAPQRMYLVDRDREAIDYLKQVFTGTPVATINQNFLAASQQLLDENRHFDMILADLGTSSPHLEKANRGFSFSKSGPLDMRMDSRQALSAETIVNNWGLDQLQRTIAEYGEEAQAEAVAKAIIANRPIADTAKLAEIVTIAKRSYVRASKIHPATKTFQAIRVAVNDELNQLKSSLPLWHRLLAPGGRLAVISFHSLEDRIVKQYFSQHTHRGYDADLIRLTKKPLRAKPDEIDINPRARSAKLRAVAKIKIER
ncbi:16S rRNA (cytosine(1402)-N(4))-methyltransferase [Candidatus Saccharibacteria bacterium RIFCSPLOWO2_01_FULL_48_13]|nr:MAG: 16S rRNA (cytosine(1402)-N(4))-methyltransferase [Candidatus Saccharibacteria bacterium RIFCSPHIGHO2_01_FULL_48_12]OGL36803.1 MAG: 16S rRNA (cytosine(1402)-N(4))-methyltransferase [Candidatus Saccharibacteria bacterium RIFCSPLOWO2_01_FULL_48_13]